jgi:hypothetical protein
VLSVYNLETPGSTNKGTQHFLNVFIGLFVFVCFLQ